MLWHKHPGLWLGCRDDEVSLNGVPGQHKPWGRMGTVPGGSLQSEEGFVEEKNVWDDLCVSISRRKRLRCLL